VIWRIGAALGEVCATNSIDRPVFGWIRRDVSWLDLLLGLMLNLRLKMGS
jgi:hypothetical protein